MRHSLSRIGRVGVTATIAMMTVCGLPIAASAQRNAASAQKITASQKDERARPPVSRRRSSSPGLITSRERVRWFSESTIGPGSLGAAASGAAWSTMRHESDGYGTGARGFGQRYAVRMGDATVRNGLEASLGAIWHEDPRYLRSRGDRRAFTRVGYAIRRSVIAPRPDGHFAPAYARYAAIVGSGFLSNAWRPRNERSVNDAFVRSASGFAGTIAGNVFLEFWPDLQRSVSRHVLRRPRRSRDQGIGSTR